MYPCIPSRLAMSLFLSVSVLAASGLASAQTPKYRVPEGASPPPLTYRGLVAGKDTLADVKAKLGDPASATSWYNYKLYYPAVGRDGLMDVVHLHGDKPESVIGDIEAASVPEGYETAEAIRAQLGEPEYELRMATWRLLDYSGKGVRFTLTPEGKTTGVAYFAHGYRRVPMGERALVDMSDHREGPQPAPASVPSLDGLQIGVAEKVISPQDPDWLGHPYVVHDELKARIAVFRKDDLTVALVGADLFGMSATDIRVIRDAATRAGVTQTLFGMSHNHAAGDTIGVYGHYPTEYVQHIQKQTEAGIIEALAAMQPVVKLVSASEELPMDGARVAGLFRNARNPGVVDPTLSVIQALDAAGKPITTIVNFACHVESLQAGAREVSADFPGYMCEQIRKEGGGQPVFLNGAVGGMVSGDNPERTHESSHEMGLKLAAIVKDLAKSAQPSAEFRFSAVRHDLEIPVTNPAFKPLFETGARPVRKGRVITDMIYFSLGEAQIVSLPGELLPEVSFEILEQMDGFPRILVGLANDQLGYILPPSDFRDDYYEESMSVGPAAAPQVRDMALRMIHGE